MKITRYEFDETAVLSLVSGDSIQAFTHNVKDTSVMSFEDLKLEFSSGSELQLKFVRNVRNTERANLIVVENEVTQNILMCGGLMAYVVSPAGEVVSSFETGYPDFNAPIFETRHDFSGFETVPLINGLALVWDYGIVFLDQEFNVLFQTSKSADTILQNASEDKLFFENGSTEARFSVESGKLTATT